MTKVLTITVEVEPDLSPSDYVTYKVQATVPGVRVWGDRASVSREFSHLTGAALEHSIKGVMRVVKGVPIT